MPASLPPMIRIRMAGRNHFRAASGSSDARGTKPPDAESGIPGLSHRNSIVADALPPAHCHEQVNTKCISGAPGRANSSLLLLCNSTARIRAASICLTASGCTRPVGWRPGAGRREIEVPLFVQDRLSHDRSSRIPCAEKRHLSGAASSCVPLLIAYEQQPGAQPLAGFVARINALINFPSTCGAIMSTSRPWPFRKALASSMS